MERNISIHGKKYKIYSFIGKAVGNDSKSVTTVYGDQYSVNSTVTSHNNIFLLADDGREEHFQFIDCDIPMRIGHTIHVFVIQSKKYSWCIGAYNVSLNKFKLSETAIKSLADDTYPRYLIIFIMIFMILFLLFGLTPSEDNVGGVFVTGPALSVIIYSSLKSNFKKTIRKKAKKEFSER